MTTLRTTTDADGVMTVWLDVPDKGVNAVSPQVLHDLGLAVDEILRAKPRGVIFASAKRSFVPGADLFEIRKMDRAGTEHFLADGQTVFDRISKLPMPTVAAINGDCLGGGLELALACTYRVAVDDGSVNIGLPEVKLGILPGWGGTVRLPRRIGLANALPLLLGGKTMPPRKAKKAGIVDEVVRPEALLAAAKRVVTANAGVGRPSLLHRTMATLPATRNKILAAARQQTLGQTRGNYPAPMKVIDVVRAGYERGPDAGLEAERKALCELMDTEACRNLMRLFFLRQGAKKWITSKVAAQPRDVKYAAVIGGGTMGAGIVHAMIRAGIQVRLIEVNEKAAAAGLGRVRKMLEDDVRSGRMTPLNARHALNRVAPTTQWTGLAMADIVVEAVIEDMAAKREVFAKLDKLTRPDAILASNTSSLPVTEMAESTANPGRVVGLHFFNPVPKMPLVEVISTAHSDDVALATAAALAGKIGKTPVLVKDAPGFLVNRVLIPYLAEALVMATEGGSITAIDAAMKDWGMPMGPFELLDEIGLDVGAHVLRSQARQTGDSRELPPAVEEALKRGWLGKKSGRGFYVHEKSKKGRGAPADLKPNEELAALISGKPAGAAPMQAQPSTGDKAAAEATQWRLILPMVNEAAKLLAEGVPTRRMRSTSPRCS